MNLHRSVGVKYGTNILGILVIYSDGRDEIESGYVHYHIEQWQTGKKHLLRESVTQ